MECRRMGRRGGKSSLVIVRITSGRDGDGRGTGTRWYGDDGLLRWSVGERDEVVVTVVS